MSGGRFAGKHQRVAAVENSVGDVGSFGARGPRILLHRIEHLRGGDDGNERVARPHDDLLLHDGNFFRAHLDAEIAARDHHAVGDGKNFVEIVDRFGLFEFGDDGNIFRRAARWPLCRERTSRAVRTKLSAT